MSVNAQTVQCYSINTRLLKEKCQGMSHEDSLMPMKFEHNCVNWTVGHILNSRNFVLETLGDDSFEWTEKDKIAYSTDASCEESATAAANGRTLPQLLEAVEATQSRLEAALASRDLREYTEKRPFYNSEFSVEYIVNFMLWHEAIHTGEVGVLRPAAGA